MTSVLKFDEKALEIVISKLEFYLFQVIASVLKVVLYLYPVMYESLQLFLQRLVRECVSSMW